MSAQAASARAGALQLVTDAVRDLLGSPAAGGADTLDPAAPLMSVGLNSTLAVTLAASIEAAVGNPVPPTLVRMLPTVKWDLRQAFIML